MDDEDLDECIANALWHECGDYVECKTNQLEEAAEVILQRLRRYGYVVVREV